MARQEAIKPAIIQLPSESGGAVILNNTTPMFELLSSSTWDGISGIVGILSFALSLYLAKDALILSFSKIKLNGFPQSWKSFRSTLVGFKRLPPLTLVFLVIGLTGLIVAGISIATPNANGRMLSRIEVLISYNDVLNTQDWCGLWRKLEKDGVISGECPRTVFEWGKTEANNPSLITGVRIAVSSEIEVRYPACVTFGQAIYSGGTVRPWIHNDYIATNVRVQSASSLSLFFRCDDIPELTPP